MSTPKLIRRVIYLASENTYANYFTRQKITHGLVFGGPLRLGALGPGPPGPLVKTALQLQNIYHLQIIHRNVIAGYEARSAGGSI